MAAAAFAAGAVVPLAVSRAAPATSSGCAPCGVRVSGITRPRAAASSLGRRRPAEELQQESGSRGPWQVVRSLVQEAEQAEADQEAADGAPAGVQETITMFFKAEGSLSEAAVPKVQTALEALDGVSHVKVYVAEGTATVELTKQSLVQESGVASGLVEVIQSNGFKMQALNLGFDDDNDDDDSLYSYDDTAEEEVST